MCGDLQCFFASSSAYTALLRLPVFLCFNVHVKTSWDVSNIKKQCVGKVDSQAPSHILSQMQNKVKMKTATKKNPKAVLQDPSLSPKSWRLFIFLIEKWENGQIIVFDEGRCFIDRVFFGNGFVRGRSSPIPWVKANRYQHRTNWLKEAWFIYQTRQGTKVDIKA